jgi:hypothetical protein
MSLLGTRLPKPTPELCPQPAEADMRPQESDSRFDPNLTLCELLLDHLVGANLEIGPTLISRLYN